MYKRYTITWHKLFISQKSKKSASRSFFIARPLSAVRKITTFVIDYIKLITG